MRSLHFKIFNIFLFTLLSLFTFGQDEDVPISNLGTISHDGDEYYVPKKFCLDDNNDLVVKVNVLLGNLQINGTYPNEYGIIPEGYDPMYIEFTVNGVVYTPSQVGNFDIVILSNGNLAFSYIAESPAVDFSSDCQNSTDGYVYTTVSYRLVTPNGDEEWDTYPACDYDNSMFACSIYPYAPWCDVSVGIGLGGAAPTPDDPTPSCYDEWFSGGYSAQMRCDCGNDIPYDPKGNEPIDDGGDMFNGDDGKNQNRSVIDNNITAYPNPMSDVLQIESIKESIRQIEIYNSRGDLVVNNVYSQEGIQNVRLNTTEFPNGLYIARIATDTGIKVIKVLK